MSNIKKILLILTIFIVLIICIITIPTVYPQFYIKGFAKSQLVNPPPEPTSAVGWHVIEPLKTNLFVPDKDIGITRIEFTLNDTIYSLQLKATKLLFKPDILPAAIGLDYQYYKIEFIGLKQAAFNRLEIKFRVEKNWLHDYDVNFADKDSINLYQMGDGEWKKVITKRIHEDELYVAYRSIIKQFFNIGYFAVFASKNQEGEEDYIEDTEAIIDSDEDDEDNENKDNFYNFSDSDFVFYDEDGNVIENSVINNIIYKKDKKIKYDMNKITGFSFVDSNVNLAEDAEEELSEEKDYSISKKKMFYLVLFVIIVFIFFLKHEMGHKKNKDKKDEGGIRLRD